MRYPFIKLPGKAETVLFLIKAELKTRNFFNRLEAVGFADDTAQCHLTELIADRLDIDIHRDEDFDRFTQILEDASEKIEREMKDEELMKIVLRVYTKMANWKEA